MGSIILGLYSRDYSILKQDEIEEKERIDKECHIEEKIHVNPFPRYPIAVRHFLSLFPNNHLDPKELINKERINGICNEFHDLLCSDGINEQIITKVIKDNQYFMIPGSIFSLYNFGHHEAYLFNEFPLGTRYRADYLLIGKSSDGYSFVFVEFEHPKGNTTIKDGELGLAFRSGINQVDEWKRFLESSFNSITDELKKYSKENLPDEMYTFDSSRFHYVVVAGRRSNFTEKTYRIRREYMKDKDIALLHYDNLFDYTRQLTEYCNY